MSILVTPISVPFVTLRSVAIQVKRGSAFAITPRFARLYGLGCPTNLCLAAHVREIASLQQSVRPPYGSPQCARLSGRAAPVR
jgi:hypothetical protein